jgi:hypothetical protein
MAACVDGTELIQDFEKVFASFPKTGALDPVST